MSLVAAGCKVLFAKMTSAVSLFPRTLPTLGCIPQSSFSLLKPKYGFSRLTYAHSRIKRMSSPRLTKLELRIMEALWNQGASSIREIQEAFPERNRPAYTTVQTTVYRMENKR